MLRYLYIVFMLTAFFSLVTAGCSVSKVTSTPPKLEPPVIQSFTASPSAIYPGQEVELRWNVIGATDISIQPEIAVSGYSSSVFVIPDSTTTYILNAKNKTEWVTKTVIVEVKGLYSKQNVIPYDPVTGRNSDFFIVLEQLCLSTAYQVQIAKDAGFSLMIYDSGIYDPASVTAPAFHYQVGGKLEAGHTYYMRYRTRQAATGQWIRSPWSEAVPFTIQSGLPITAPAYN